MNNKGMYVQAALRIALGILFIGTGWHKLQDPSATAGFLASLGFPIEVFFAWILLLSELVFGVSVLIGWKVKYTVWPLVFILAVASITAVKGFSNIFFHLIAIIGLISLSLQGPGAFSVNKE